MHRVAALALPDVVAFDLAIPAQVFGHRHEGDRYAFDVCAPSAGLAPSTTVFSVYAEHGLDALAGADTIIVPGYAPHDAPPDPVLEALQRAATRGARMVSTCTGAFALAAAGLLDGQRATTHWYSAGELAGRHPKVEVDADVLYIADRGVRSSAGVAAGIDLCLELVRHSPAGSHTTRADP